MLYDNLKSPEIHWVTQLNNVEVYCLRDDLNHPEVQGNKFWKLKYNLLKAKDLNKNSILTFGGAFSNHLLATASACNQLGFKSIGIVRGEELVNKPLNFTLKSAQEKGMQLQFVSRENYRLKEDETYLEQLQLEFPDAYLLPEGGTNELAVKGCMEILGNHTDSFDFITVPIGTAGTITGLLNSAKKHQKILGFPALKDSEFLRENIQKWTSNLNYEIINAYHFGGYAKFNTELITFVNDFYAQFQIPLDPIYTGKMVFGLWDLIKNGYFENQSKVLIVHTGGLQGIQGFNQQHKNLINYI